MKVFGIICGVVVLIFGTLLALAPAIAETMAFRKFPPAEREQMKARFESFKKKKITLPAEAIEAPPYSAETQAAAEVFVAAWDKFEDPAKNVANQENSDGKKLSRTETEREMATLTPLLNAFATLARRPDYDVGVTGSIRVHREGSLPYPDFLAIQSCAKLMRLRAQADTRAGQHRDALRNAETAVLASHAGPYETLISQLIGIAIGSIGSAAWIEAVRACDNPDLLRETLQAQERLAGRMNWLSAELPFESVDVVGMVRDMKRRGIAVEFQGLTGRELLARAMDSQCAYLEQYVLPAVKDDPKLAEKARENIRMARKNASLYGGGESNLAGVIYRMGGRISAPVLYTIAVPNFLEAAARAENARSKFDMLRIETARKLYRIEKGKAPESNAALTPEYLAQLPTDRNAKKDEKAIYRMAGEVVYSVGPDGKDDGFAVMYDSSNGTMSRGDLALGR